MNPKCQAADSCTNDAYWSVSGRLVNRHVCCHECKATWKRMTFLQKKGNVTFKPLYHKARKA